MAQAFIDIEFTVLDADNEQAKISLGFVSDVAVSSDDVPTLVATVWALIRPLTTGYLAGARWRQGAYPAGDAGTPADVLADVQEKAQFYWRADDPLIRSITYIPCFVESKLVNGGAGKEVDITDTDVVAFITGLTSGIPQDISGHFLRHEGVGGELLTHFDKAKQSFIGRLLRKKR